MKIKQVKKDTIQPIKPFQTIDEEAEYWDTHSILDDINEGTAVGFLLRDNQNPQVRDNQAPQRSLMII